MAEKIYSAITAVMEDIGAIGKEKKNITQGFMYRGIDDVMNALNPAFIKNKLFAVPEIIEQQREERRTAKGGLLIYSICKVKYTFFAEDGSSVTVVTIGEGMDSGDKATNKAMAIAFKYACFQLFCIPTEEMQDPDKESHELEEPKIKVEEYKALVGELKRTGVGVNGIYRKYRINDLHNLNMSQYNEAMNILKYKPDIPVTPKGMDFDVPEQDDEGLPFK